MTFDYNIKANHNAALKIKCLKLNNCFKNNVD